MSPLAFALRARWYVLPAVLLSMALPVQPSNSKLVITYSGRGSYADSSLVRVALGEGRKAHHISGKSFTSGHDSAFGYKTSPHVGPIRVGTHGELPVRVALVGPAGDTLASVSTALRLEPRYEFWIEIIAGRVQRPKGMCTGEIHAVSIGPGPQGPLPDSLFVLTGGMPAGAVC